MYTADQLVASLRGEVDIIKHLAARVPEGTLDWRLSPAQRSTEELLRYLTVCAWSPATWIRDGKWDAVEGLEKQAAAMDLADFDAAMDRQADELEAIVRGFSEDELRERPSAMPWGAPCTTGQGLVDMCLKCLTAYRMQLFLHAKASGNTDLGPANCWAGVDRPPAS